MTDKAGNPLDRNPLKDVRVRRAISRAINRQALVDRIMDGQAIPAGQIVPEGFFGYDPAIKVEAFDPDGARALLREAGYPEGFGITLHAPNNRYVNDDKLAQAIGAMLTRAGIQTKVETLPSNVFFPRWGRLEHSIQLVGWGSGSGEAAASLRTQVATYHRESGWGASNVGRYSNPAFDTLLRQVFATIDRPARERLLQQASALSITDQAFIPLHFQVNIWAMKRGVTYKARSDEYTLAQEFRPAP
ncbi:MAG: hypothetical protein FJX57_24280 [Alphaproteobacteria bacterium]|nr:hypothetical protein [Alphaproteobacteria bacterium]